METTKRIVANLSARRKLRAAIKVWRNNVIELDVVVNDTQIALDRARDDHQRAERERNRAAVHLAQLIDQHEEIEGIAATFGPEIAEEFARAMFEAAA